MDKNVKKIKILSILGLSLGFLTSCVDMDWLNSIPLPFNDALCNEYFWEKGLDFGLNMPLPGVPGDIVTSTPSSPTPSGYSSTSPVTPTVGNGSSSSQEYQNFYFSSDENFKFSDSDMEEISYHLNYFYNNTHFELEEKSVDACSINAESYVSNDEDAYSFSLEANVSYEIEYTSSYAHSKWNSSTDFNEIYLFDMSVIDANKNLYYVMESSQNLYRYDTTSNSISFLQALSSAGLGELYDPYVIMCDDVLLQLVTIMEDLEDNRRYYCKDIVFLYAGSGYEMVVTYYDVACLDVSLRLNIGVKDNFITYSAFETYDAITDMNNINKRIRRNTYIANFNSAFDKGYPSEKGYTKSKMFH